MTDKLREEIAELLWNSAGPEITWQAYLKLADTGDAYAVGQIAFVREQAGLVLPSIQREIARARADALEEAAQHLIDEELDNAEVYAAAIRALKEKP
jgi:hypothetical protein